MDNIPISQLVVSCGQSPEDWIYLGKNSWVDSDNNIRVPSRQLINYLFDKEAITLDWTLEDVQHRIGHISDDFKQRILTRLKPDVSHPEELILVLKIKIFRSYYIKSKETIYINKVTKKYKIFDIKDITPYLFPHHEKFCRFMERIYFIHKLVASLENMNYKYSIIPFSRDLLPRLSKISILDNINFEDDSNSENDIDS